MKVEAYIKNMQSLTSEGADASLASTITVEDLVEFMQTKEACGERAKPWMNVAIGSAPSISPELEPVVQISRSDAFLLRSLSNLKRKEKMQWTEKQREAAIMLVHKYRKQLMTKFGIDVLLFITNPTWRNSSPRVLSTYKGIRIANDRFIVEAPYIPGLIKLYRSLCHYEGSSPVDIHWDAKERVWTFDMSMYSLRVLYKIACDFGPFELSDEVQNLFNAYGEAWKHPSPPTIGLSSLGSCWLFENLTPRQQEIANSIVYSDVSDIMKIWALADCQFTLDNSVRQLLSKYTPIEQNIVMSSNPIVTTLEMTLVSLIDFLIRIDVTPICISYGWTGNVIKDKIIELKRLWGDKVIIEEDLFAIENRITRYQNPVQAMHRPMRPEPGQIRICKRVGNFGLEYRQPVLITLTGLISDSTDDLVKATGFTKVINLQPTI